MSKSETYTGLVTGTADQTSTKGSSQRARLLELVDGTVSGLLVIQDALEDKRPLTALLATQKLILDWENFINDSE